MASRSKAKPLPANALPERIDLAKALRIALPIGSGAKPSGGGRPEASSKSAGAAPVDWRDPAAVKQAAPLFTVARGRPVMLAIANGTSAAALFQLHNQPFRLLDTLDDGWKPFWLDTYPVQPGQTARVAFVPDAAGKRMLHTRPLTQPEAATFWWYAVT